MPTVTIPADLLEQLGTLARPFVDKEPADVIRRLVSEYLGMHSTNNFPTHSQTQSEPSGTNSALVIQRQPRERGASVLLDGFQIRADSVPDLIKKLAERISDTGHWPALQELAPYKTSSERYLFSKKPIHPNANEFFVEVKHKDLVFEAHKNYKTTISQFERLFKKLGVRFEYKGS